MKILIIAVKALEVIERYFSDSKFEAIHRLKWRLNDSIYDRLHEIIEENDVIQYSDFYPNFNGNFYIIPNYDGYRNKGIAIAEHPIFECGFEDEDDDVVQRIKGTNTVVWFETNPVNLTWM